MKERILMFLCVVSASVALFASPMNDGETTSPIPITKEGTKRGGVLRSPEFIPFQAYLIKDANVVNLHFLRDVGVANVELINKDNGEYISDVIDSCQGNVLFLFSGSEGVYELTVTLSGGTSYIGEFEL